MLRLWRRRRESNPCTRFCRPLPGPLGHVATRRSAGCPARIRTSVRGSKVRCPTTRRRGIASSHASRSAATTQPPRRSIGKWSGRRDSNPRPSPWQGDALPTEPLPPALCARLYRVAGAEGQNRTDDTRLFRAVLYRLSYLGADRTASGGRKDTDAARGSQPDRGPSPGTSRIGRLTMPPTGQSDGSMAVAAGVGLPRCHHPLEALQCDRAQTSPSSRSSPSSPPRAAPRRPRRPSRSSRRPRPMHRRRPRSQRKHRPRRRPRQPSDEPSEAPAGDELDYRLAPNFGSEDLTLGLHARSLQRGGDQRRPDRRQLPRR